MMLVSLPERHIALECSFYEQSGKKDSFVYKHDATLKSDEKHGYLCKIVLGIKFSAEVNYFTANRSRK